MTPGASVPQSESKRTTSRCPFRAAMCEEYAKSRIFQQQSKLLSYEMLWLNLRSGRQRVSDFKLGFGNGIKFDGLVAAGADGLEWSVGWGCSSRHIAARLEKNEEQGTTLGLERVFNQLRLLGQGQVALSNLRLG